MAPTLGPEIWLQIFEYLRKPLPPPHAETRPESSDIRQSALASVIRVARTWYCLAAPILYRIAFVDSLSHFLYGLHFPTIPGLIPKVDLLAYTTRLYLEYEYNSPAPDPDQDPSDRPRSWDPEVIVGTALYERHVAGIEEAQRIFAAFKSMTGEKGVMRHLFHRLRFLSIGAYAGTRGDARFDFATLFPIWQDNGLSGGPQDRQGYLRKSVRSVLLHFVAAHASTLERYCETQNLGPLTLDTHAQTDITLSPYELCLPPLSFHYHSEDASTRQSFFGPKRVFIPLGASAQQYIHRTRYPEACERDIDFVRALAFSGLRRALAARRMLVVDAYTTSPSAGWAISNVFYLSTRLVSEQTSNPVPTPIEREVEMRLVQSQMEELIADYRLPRREWCQPEDKVEVKQMYPDAPTCEACCWSVDL